MSFWSHVEKTDGCWFWRGYVHSHGYGSATHEGKTWRAHRLAYTLAVGSIPNGLFVLHTCDEKSCVNPAHLYVGTHRRNMMDRRERGRVAKGTNHGRAKLVPEDVREIRRMVCFGVSHCEMARRYETTHSHIGRIVRRENWAHVN